MASCEIRSPELGKFPFGQAAGGLVEQQQPGLRDQGAGQRDALAVREGKLAGEAVGHAGHARPVQCRQRAVPQRLLVAVGPARPGHRGPETCPGVAGGPGHDVLQHGEPGEQAEALQRAGDAEGGEPVRPQPGKFGAVEAQLPGIGMHESAQHVEEGGLARTVRPDDPGDLPRRGDERHGIQRGEATEPHRDVADLQHARPVVRRLRRPRI